MRFFTIDWWSGDLDDSITIFDDYKRFLEPFFSDLPPDHQRLTSEVSLHDSRLLSHVANYQDKTLTLKLDGCGYDESSQSYFGRRFSLFYGGVISITTTADPDKGLPGPHGFGDLGYDEIELIESGVYEHRMLFSSGIVMRVLHRQFELNLEDYQYEEGEQVGDGDAEEAV